LVHGFTGALNEMRPLGEHLASQGYTALGVRLSGHGTHMQDLIRTRKQDWIADVEDGYHILRGMCDRVFLLGLSLGGVLILHASSYLPVTGLVAMSAPYTTPEKRLDTLRPILPLLSKVWRYRPQSKPGLPGKSGKLLYYPAQPIRSLAEADDMIDLMQIALPEVTAPALIIHSHSDTVFPIKSATCIYDAISSEDKDIHLLEKNEHVVTRGEGCEIVFKACEQFIKRVLETSR